VVSFTPRTLYLRGNEKRNALNRRLGGPRGRSGRFGENTLASAGFPYLPVRSLVAIPTDTELHRLQNVTNTVWIEEGLSLPARPD
jgi:hypothetical protein